MSKDQNSVGVDGPSSMRRSAELGLIARDQIACAVQVRTKDGSAHHHVHEIMRSSRCSIETEGALCRTSISSQTPSRDFFYIVVQSTSTIRPRYTGPQLRCKSYCECLAGLDCCSAQSVALARRAPHPSRSLGSSVNNHLDEDGRATSLGQFLSRCGRTG